MSDSDTVVFVGVPDLAKIIVRTRARISQLHESGGVLPKAEATVNGKPVWRLDSVIRPLKACGYDISAEAEASLRKTRSVPSNTVPVGVAEAAEVLGVPPHTMRRRADNKTTAPVLFMLGRERVWDLNILVAHAESLGHSVNLRAYQEILASSGDGAPAGLRQADVLVKIHATAAGTGDSDVAQAVSRHIETVLNATRISESGDVRLAGPIVVSVQLEGSEAG